ncbi:transposase [Actinomadura sp. LOL_016]|uniref:transposase n=1 Tax=unclassified Actinomadura TaxID=2626254 RepID=UPI003A7F6F92
MAQQRRHFTQEHKDEIVRMVLDGPRPIAHVAREVGIHDTTLGNWVKDYRRRHGDDASTTSAGEPKSIRERELERENRKLREENEFLKTLVISLAHARARARHTIVTGHH